MTEKTCILNLKAKNSQEDIDRLVTRRLVVGKFKGKIMKYKTIIPAVMITLALAIGCAEQDAQQSNVQMSDVKTVTEIPEAPEYFLLRPEVEKAYGYSHAVRIGNDLKISGAVSMDDSGNPTAADDMEQQIKNVYADLGKVLAHYGYSFDDVIVENVFTTDMAAFLEAAAYRNSVYTNHFPTGSWLEVKGLALPEFMIEIELEAHKAR